MTSLISRLKEAAEKATKGPWTLYYGTQIPELAARCEGCSGPVDFANQEDADYIALCSPENILLLIEKLRIARDALKHIAKYDCPAEGGIYSKVWMTLGKRASEALAELEKE